MDFVMTHHRHPIVNHPRVWQPWYIGGEDKATVHPVDFSSSIHSGLNCPYEQLPSRSLRLKRRQQERRSSDKSKRCLTDHLEHVRRCTDSKENVSIPDYLSDADDDQPLSDEDTGKLVVDDNVEDEEEEEEEQEDPEELVVGKKNKVVNDDGDDRKSPPSRDQRHPRSVDGVDSEEEDNDDEEDEMEEREEREKDEGDDDDEETATEEVEEEQEGPLDMTTNNRSRNQNTTNAPRWSPSSSSSSPPAVNMSPIFYPHPPRYNPYVSSAPPPPYHPLPHHHLSTSPHSASPPPYLPPSYFTDALTTNTTTNGHRSVPTSSSLRPAHTLQQHRPSVITCASTSNTTTKTSPPPASLPLSLPPHHHQHHHRQSSVLNSSGNHHNHQQQQPQQQQHHRNCPPNVTAGVVGADSVATNGSIGVINRRALSDPTASRPHLTVGGGHQKSRRSSDHVRYGHRREILSGMCDPVIDEHFRRSLGKDYPEYLSSSVSTKTPHVNSKNSSPVGNTNPSSTSSTSSISITGMSVDDHFAKALGETWLRLQNKGIPTSPVSSTVNASGSPSSKPSSPATSVGSGYVSNSMSPKSVSPSPAVQQSQQRQSIVST